MEFKRAINEFGQHPNTILLQKLLDPRQNRTSIFLPEQFRYLMLEPTNTLSHQKLTRELIDSELLPLFIDDSETLKKYVRELSHDIPFETSSSLITTDMSFWYLALCPENGCSSFYRWEHTLYREVLDDYLRRLEALFHLCDKTIKDFDTALNYINSLYFFTVPIRLDLGESGIFASETLLMDYVSTSFPILYNLFFRTEDEENIDTSVVKAINPLIIKEEFPRCVMIDHILEKDVIYNSEHQLDPSWTEDDGFSIFWWLPDSISCHLDDIIIKSRQKDGKMDDVLGE